MSSSTVQAPKNQEKAPKRNREEGSPLETNIFKKGFKIMYRKKAKINSRLSISKDLE